MDRGIDRFAREIGGMALLALGLLAAQPAWATTVRSLSLYEKSQVASDIVRARAQRIESSWVIEGGSAQTAITLEVIEVLKGEMKPGETFVLHQGGGRIGDFVHRIPGMSEFKVGEEAILFVEPYRQARVEIGVGIGKYGIQISPDGERYVTHDPKVALAVIEDGKPIEIQEAKAMQPELLDKFKTRVRDYVRGAQKPGPSRQPPTLKPELLSEPLTPSTASSETKGR